MSQSRRLMNLIVTSRSIAAPSLSWVDLRSQLFGHALTPESRIRNSAEQYYYPRRILEPAASLKMERLRLPSPIFTYGALSFPREHVVDCFPLTDGKVVFSERSGPTTLFDAHACRLVHLPKLHKPKEMPISLFVPSADGGDHQSGDGGSLYVMERIPNPEVCSCSALSGQFETFVCDSSQTTASTPQWHCRRLLPPPFVRSRNYYTRIISYAVVGSDIWISTDSAGTHRLDTTIDFSEKSTARHLLWGFVGSWTLPFRGKVEYVPDLKLWFGFSSQGEGDHFAAADLLTTTEYSQPRLVGDFKEFEPPEGWVPTDDCQFAYLGSGCFCIARFYRILADDDDHLSDYYGELEENWVAVLTGVEATWIEPEETCGGTGKKGKVIKFTKHKSRCLISSGPIITNVF